MKHDRRERRSGKGTLAGKTARAHALELLYRVDVHGHFAAPILRSLLEREDISPLDKGLIHELVYGVLRWRGRLDWVIERGSNRPMEEMTPWIRNILRLGAHQLLFTQKIPPAAAVHESVKLAYSYGHRGTAAFVNAILRWIQRCGKAISFPDPHKDLGYHLAVLYSHPDWLIRRWLERYGLEGTVQICQANNLPPPLTIRTNTALIDRESLKQALQRERVNVDECLLAPEGLHIHSPVPIFQLSAFLQGWFHVQDESSILVGYLLAPRPGERILDACAGSGGKTTHLAQLMENQGEVWALDVQDGRLKSLEEACRRLQINIVRTQVQDVTERRIGLGEFEAILVDAPCSGLGVVRRHPEARWLKKEGDLARLCNLQLRILKGVQGWLKPKPGAALVYGVCSHEPEENQTVIEQFLDEHPQFVVEDPRPYLPGDRAKQECSNSAFLSLPSVSHQMDGFFAVRLRRV